MTATSGVVTSNESIGCRRVILLLLLACNYAIVAINHALPTFQGYTPHYFCQVDSVSPSIQGCVQQLNSSVEENEASCPQGYQFESDRNDWTVVTEWQLICERRFLRPLLATLYFCGVTLGAVICGLLADRYGRRPVVLICLYAQGLLGASLYFTKTLATFMILRFSQGFFVQGLQGTTFALLVELFPLRFRTAVGVVLELYWALGLVYLAGASYYIPNWRSLQLVLSIPTAATLLYVCIVPESARWLSTNGKIEEAQKVLKKLCKNDIQNNINSIKSNGISDEAKCTRNCENSLRRNGVTNSQQITNSQDKVQIEINDFSSNGKAVVIRNLIENNELDGVSNKKDGVEELLTDCPKEPSDTDFVSTNSSGPSKQDENDTDILPNNSCSVGSDSGITEGSSSSNHVKTIDIKENVRAQENNETSNDSIMGDVTLSCMKSQEENNPSKKDFADANKANIDMTDSGTSSQMVVKELNQPQVNKYEIYSIGEISRSGSESDGINYKWTENTHDPDDDENIPSSTVKTKIQNECDCRMFVTKEDGAQCNEMYTATVKNSSGKCSSCDEARTHSENEIIERRSSTVQGFGKIVEKTACLDDFNEPAVDHEVAVIYKNTGNKCTILKKKELRDSMKAPDIGLKRKRSGFLELFSNRILRKYNLIMIYVWFSVSLTYYGIMFQLPDLSGERHLNFLLGAILEVISYVLAYVILSRFGRRIPMASYLLISGLICVIVGAVSVVPEEDAYWIGKAQTALALLGKAAVVSGFCTMFLYASELFPTILRAAAMGHCGFWGRVGSLIAPQLLFLGEYTLPAVPLVIMGVLGMSAGLLVLALPETLGQQLPDTVEEVEMLVTSKRRR